MSALLDVRDLTVRFPVRGRGLLARSRDLVAVDAVSFDLKAGETLGIVGESGCGKSTLGRAVLGLVGAQEGRIAWMGQDLRTLEAGKMRPLRRDLQIVFQDPLASLDPRMNVGDIVAEPLGNFEPGLPRGGARRRACATCWPKSACRPR